MAVILVLTTFAIFIAIDYFMTRSKKVVDVSTPEQTPVAATLVSSASIEGILVPDQLRYHAGHTWLREEQAKVARVGADAFAISNMGTVEHIEVPKVGRWVRQGQKAFTFRCGAETVELVSPAEGEVVEVNTAVIKDPQLATKDPYGNGWLVKVNMPERETVLRNLLPETLVRTWMKDEIRRVRQSAPAATTGKIAVMGGGSYTMK
jgi:glycine cleavage system H protein